MSKFVFSPSVQSDLFSYLKPKQQEQLKPMLRVLKKPAQESLCVALLDYLEQGLINPPKDIAIGGIFYYCTKFIVPLKHSAEPINS